MRFKKTKIPGAYLIDPDIQEDSRGRFLRAWCSREFVEQGLLFSPVQANMGFSIRRGTIRGMHFQKAPALEAKLVRCTRGKIYDVIVDIRSESPSYREYYGTELSAENGRMLYVPENCAHGYQTLEDNTEIYYMASGYYAPNLASGVRFNDLAFGIKWPLPVTAVSERDRQWPMFEIRGMKR